MTKTIFFLLFSIFLIGCKETPKDESTALTHFETMDYVKVGQLFDSIKTPYIIDISNGKKRLVFVGCDHQVPATHPQFAAIQRLFWDLKPQMTFNEGGQYTDSLRYENYQKAIGKDGESGALKYWSDSLHVKMMNGDLSAKEEFALTSRYHTQEEWYLYYIMERCIVPFIYNNKGGKLPFDSVFNQNMNRYFLKNGLKITDEQRSFAHFKTVYQKNMAKPFDLKNVDIEAFDYVNPDCRFCAVGRISKMVRDSVLLTKIDDALTNFDRVMVTFGHGHALAIEPALRQIVNKKR
ncbi:MAG: hypothetical protein U5L45_14245 [Saprospiraceae bacterium]|nr:hypothetical protein [Saprospiraceae bacterium]